MKGADIDRIAEAVVAKLRAAPVSEWFTTVQAAAYLGRSKQSLEIMRCKGGGPVYHKGGRQVRYHRDALDQWLRGGERRNTSETSE